MSILDAMVMTVDGNIITSGAFDIVAGSVITFDAVDVLGGGFAISCDSSMLVSGVKKWENLEDTSETWDAISDTPETWTPISDNSNSWQIAA